MMLIFEGRREGAIAPATPAIAARIKTVTISGSGIERTRPSSLERLDGQDGEGEAERRCLTSHARLRPD